MTIKHMFTYILKSSKNFFHLDYSLSLILVACFNLFTPLIYAEKNKTLITITQIIDHPSANAVREGIKKSLEELGYIDGRTINWIYKNPQGNSTTNIQIAQQFVSMNPNILVAISTPSAQALVSAARNRDIPVVFAAVTDPVNAGIVKDLKKPGGFVTGVSDFPPLEKQVMLIKKMLPQAKVIGVIYNPGEINSTKQFKLFEVLAKKEGLEVLSVTAIKTSDVHSAALSLIKKIDAFYVPLDNTVLSAMDTLIKLQFDFQKPIFTSETDSVSQGALATAGAHLFDIGKSAGKMIARILQGENPGNIAVEMAQVSNLTVNMKTLNNLKLKLPVGPEFSFKKIGLKDSLNKER
jgi:putative ABC transport system substrate-binding protein